MPSLHPAVFRCRYHLAEQRERRRHGRRCSIVRQARQQRRASEGAGCAPKCRRLNGSSGAASRCLTLVTDVPNSARLAYVGIDNRAAGETAAYLIGGWLGGEPARCAGHLEQQPLSRRGGARDRFSPRAARALSGARHRRGERRPWHRPPDRTTGAAARSEPRHRRCLFGRRRQAGDRCRPFTRSAAPAASSSATISTPTTSRCFAPAHFRGAPPRSGAGHAQRLPACDARAWCTAETVVPGVVQLQVITPFNLPHLG